MDENRLAEIHLRHVIDDLRQQLQTAEAHLRALLKYYDEGIGWMYNEGALEDNEYREAKELGQATVAWLESQE